MNSAVTSMSGFLKSSFLRPSLLALSAVLSLSLSGCGVGPVTASNGADTIAGPIAGIIHGGPNPVVGAEVIIYATTSTGYGVGAQLQEATQVGASTHQDTSSTGNFSFTGGFTCPAGAYAYIVAYGGNSGAGNNPNSVLMAALGACSSLYSGTTYTGPVVWVDELTTVAAGYALSNFIGITGNAVGGYTVGIGADSTNAAATGCVHNAFYGLATCPTTTGAGLAHAFANAAALVSTSTGQANTTTATSAIIPNPLINALGNILQACVNSTGGGTNASTGLPTTTTSASGTTYDGTNCGALSAFTSYTLNGTPTGTLVAAGNTLGFVQNLAKHPGGSSTTFNSACASGSSGATSAATCIFSLSTPNVYYTPNMSAAPPDWSLSIQWPKGSFSSTTNATTGCSGSPTTSGLLYPFMLATDINDDLVILNGDASTIVCINLLSIGFDGTPIGAIPFDNTVATTVWLSTDDFGHAIVPVHGGGGTANANNGVRIYEAGPTDTSISLITTYESATTAAANAPYYTGVDQNDTIWIAAENAANDLGWLALSGSNSHASPTYTGGVTSTAVTSNMTSANIDVTGNVFSVGSSSSGTERIRVIPAQIPSATTNATEAASTTEGSSNTTSNGFMVVPDNAGKAWVVDTAPASGTSGQGVPLADEVFSTAYTTSSGIFSAFATSSTNYAGSTTSEYDYKIEAGGIDGNGVIWWGDLQSVSNASDGPVYPGYLKAFDTVNAAYYPVIYGCAFNAALTYPITGWASVTGGITSITLTNGGSGYTSTTIPTITISGGGGSGATAVAYVNTAPSTNSAVTGIVVTNPGSGYTSAPTVAFSAGAAAATAAFGNATTFSTSTSTVPSAGSTVALSGFTTTTAFNGQNVSVIGDSTTSPYSFTVSQTFGLSGSNTETGTGSFGTGTKCGSNAGDPNYPSNGPYPFYGTRGVAIDSAGDVWTTNGTQGRITEVIGIAAPTWPQFIHNGTSNKP